MHAAALALIGTLSAVGQVGQVGPVAPPVEGFVLDNGVARATFVGEAGSEDELARLELLQERRTIRLLTSKEQPRRSAGWSVLLRDRRAPFAPGKFATISAEDPRFDVERLPASEEAPPRTAMTIRFVAEGMEFDGARFSLVVIVRWRLAPGRAFLEAEFSLTIPGLARLPFYVSQITAPSLYVRDLGEPSDTHELVIPSMGGLLIQDPLKAPRFPRIFGGRGERKPWVAPWIQVPLLAYYDEATRDCLCLCDDDVHGCFRDYEVVRHAELSDGRPYLELRCRYLPDDVYVRESWTLPFHSRISASGGDWIDVARAYRGFLADPASHATFYKGPIGARTDVAPEIKDVVLHAYLQSSIAADDLDRFARGALDVDRLAGGGGTLEVWSAGFFPDQFEQFYFKGWLPGRPSLACAVREAQVQAGALVAPYVNCAAGVDHVEAGVTEPTPLMRSIRAAAVVTETGQRFLSSLGAIRADGECNGDARWSQAFVDNVVDIVRFTGARSIYLDAFTTAPCFAGPDSIAPHPDHAPGGGNYMVRGRVRQLRSVRRALAGEGLPFSGFVMEGHSLWYIGDIDVMHASPSQVSLTDGFAANGDPLPIENAKTIPFFRMVADSVKLSQFTDDDAATLGRRAWLDAVDVFEFGMVPHVCNPRVDLAATYGEELLREAAPLDRYLRRLAGCLRSGFLRYHNGTLERPPAARIAPPGFDVKAASASDPKHPYLDPWRTDAVVSAIYRAAVPADGIALVATNPWIATPGAPEFTIEAEVRPEEYGIDRERNGYTVTLCDEEGRPLQTWRKDAGESFSISMPLPAGAIRYWTFRD